MYVHSSSIEVKNTPIKRSIYIYMGWSHDCNKILIGCFLIWILEGTSIMYASPVHVCILLYIIMTQLQSVVTVVHEYGIYETMPRSHKGHKYILCIIDEVTNYLITVPIFQARSEEIGKALIENLITKYCIPKYIIMDQDSVFISSLITYLLH